MKSLFNMIKKYFLIIVFEKNRLKKSFLIFKGFLKDYFISAFLMIKQGSKNISQNIIIFLSFSILLYCKFQNWLW